MPGSAAPSEDSSGDARVKALHLTEEEALALLEVCMMTEADDNAPRSEAMTKLGFLCRDFLHEKRLTEVAVVRVADCTAGNVVSADNAEDTNENTAVDTVAENTVGRLHKLIEQTRHHQDPRREAVVTPCV